MSDPQRTHEASAKRVEEFRKRGDIALSRELVSTAALAGGVVALAAFAGSAGGSILELTRDASLAADGRPTSWLAGAAAGTFLVATAPALIGGSAAAAIAIVAQLGFPPAFKPLKLDFTKLSPHVNLPRAFGLGGIAKRTAGAIAKLGLIGAIVVVAVRGGLSLQALEAEGVTALAMDVTSRALWWVVGILAALAAGDYLMTRRRLTSQMKMTTEEVKREHRESNGDPMLNGKRKARMRELAKRRLVANVSKADVIVVNPTHYAVALRYEESTDRAPLVVAKGVDEQAEKIREIARQHGVPVLSRPPLARALHKHVKEGRPVPANLYRAVAEVLAYVYRLRKGGNP